MNRKQQFLWSSLPTFTGALDVRRMMRFETETDPTTDPASGTTGQEPTGSTGSPTTTEPAATPQPSNVQELPDWAQTLVTDLRAENAKHRKAKTDAEAEAAKAREDDLAKREEWKQLAEQREARIGELEPTAAQMSALTERVAAMMNDEIKSWPEEVKALAPEGEVSPALMLDWLDKHRPLAKKLSETPPASGNGPGPRPKGTPAQHDERAQMNRRAFVQSRF